MNIAEATRKVLSKYPYLDEYMGLGIINQRALARAIREGVSKELEHEVNIQSVVSAVRRHPVARGRKGKEKLFSILSRSEVSLRYDVGAVTISLDAKNSGAALRRLDDGLIMIRGIETLTIVVEEGHVTSIKEKFAGAVIDSNKNLASVIVKSPKEIASAPGVIAHLANILAIEKINIVEMMSSYTETWFIVDESDALKTVEALRQEVRRARK